MVDLRRAKRKADKTKRVDRNTLLTKALLGIYLGGMFVYGLFLSTRRG